jgi:hypothetical protein
MTNELLFGLAGLVLFGVARPISADSQPKQAAQLQIRGVLPWINVGLELHTLGEHMFVPYCGEMEGVPILCMTAVRMEVEAKQGWRPANLRTTFGVLGGMTLDRASGKVVAPSTTVFFVFRFSRRFFEVDPGQRLRVVVDAWADEESMRSGGRPTQLSSPAFECPESGFGQ